VTYPTILLVLMAVVMLVLVTIVMPVFSSVYASLAGSISASAYVYMKVAYVISYIALIVTLVIAVFFLVGFVIGGTEGGARKLESFFEKFPYTRRAYYEFALAHFTTALSTFVASGIDPDTAVSRLAEEVTHTRLKAVVGDVKARMESGKSFSQAAQDADLFEPLYTRMLISGSKSGNLDGTLAYLSTLITEDATTQMDRLINRIEPLFAGFLTIVLGCALISIMLPLIGMLGAL